MHASAEDGTTATASPHHDDPPRPPHGARPDAVIPEDPTVAMSQCASDGAAPTAGATPRTAGPPPTTATPAPGSVAEHRPDGAGGAASDVRCDVLVIGGGIIGLVTAWRAAQRGLRTVLADPAPGGGAAQVAAGMLAAVTETHFGEETLLGLNLASARRYPDFAAELTEASGQPTGYRACGTLAVALDSDDRAQLRDLHALQQRCGLDARWLTGRECRRLEPLLAPGVRGGVWVEGDHQIDPRLLAAALLTACRRAGVTFRHSWARRLTLAGAGETREAAEHVDGRRATGAVLADGARVAAGQVVLAGGSLSGRLAGLPADVVPPVRPVKGQLLRLRVPAPLAAAGPFLSRTVRAVVRGGQIYLVPRVNGELIVGATTEELGWDTTVTAGGLYELLRDAHEVLPGVTELELVETLAGLRPGSPDNAPLLGPSRLPGLVLATGHHRNGVLLTPVTGDVLADVLTTGALPPHARPFTPLRFSPAPAPAPATAPARAEANGARRPPPPYDTSPPYATSPVAPAGPAPAPAPDRPAPATRPTDAPQEP
ncbi:glycine oxidase ThiO [Streptomyces buecherae]|uniref:glycine oxidase ThiO n=1 Tax=Streptomyces buecherae TaxID=2763006 RepID=UPI0020B7E32C|nr:glycine oxidase ThiO [Streptomyces buecherae]